MKIALAQTNILWEEKEKNIEKAIRWLDVAKEHGVDLVCFPEMSFTGFSMNTKVTSEKDKETVREMERLGKSYGMAIGFGWVQAGKPLCENHYSIVNANGREVLDYAKIHPFSYSEENQHFVGGNSLSLCKLGDMSVGTAICYDLRFPEIFQTLSKKAELIVVPANWPKKRRAHWTALLTARAIENQCYLAGVNCCGKMDGTDYSGDSALYAPDGSLMEPVKSLTMGSESVGEKLLIYEIENNVQAVRKEFPVKEDRREELYPRLKI